MSTTLQKADVSQNDPPSTDRQTSATESPSPQRIMQLGFGFMGSKTLLSATELGLFTILARGPRDAESLRLELGIHPRSAHDFFDTLVALGLLDRRDGKYSNTAETDFYLDRNKPAMRAEFSNCAVSVCIRIGVQSPKPCARVSNKTNRKIMAKISLLSCTRRPISWKDSSRA